MVHESLIEEGSKAGEIAKIALGLFSQKGYAGTSMLDIARAAGVGKSTLYGYFATKEDLFRAATYVWARKKVTGLQNYLSGFEDPLAQLKSLANFVDRAVDTHKDAMARMFVEFLRQSLIEGGALYDQPNYFLEEMLKAPKIIEEVFLEGVARGIFKPQIARSAEKLSINLIAYIDGIIFRGFLVDDIAGTRECLALHLDSLAAMCLAEPQGPMLDRELN